MRVLWFYRAADTAMSPRDQREHNPKELFMYGTFRPNFHHFDRFGLDLRGHIHVRGAAFSCLRLKLADIVLI